MTLTVADIKRVVAVMREQRAGTIYVRGQRCYVANGFGWINPGPHKQALRSRLAKR